MEENLFPRGISKEYIKLFKKLKDFLSHGKIKLSPTIFLLHILLIACTYQPFDGVRWAKLPVAMGEGPCGSTPKEGEDSSQGIAGSPGFPFVFPTHVGTSHPLCHRTARPLGCVLWCVLPFFTAGSVCPRALVEEELCLGWGAALPLTTSPTTPPGPRWTSQTTELP